MLTTIFNQITTCSTCQGWGFNCSDCHGHGIYLDKGEERLVFALPTFFAFKKRLLLSRIKKLLVASILLSILVIALILTTTFST